jgi:hypothetical protein
MQTLRVYSSGDEKEGEVNMEVNEVKERRKKNEGVKGAKEEGRRKRNKVCCQLRAI